jgi:hypothetical protein
MSRARKLGGLTFATVMLGLGLAAPANAAPTPTATAPSVSAATVDQPVAGRGGRRGHWDRCERRGWRGYWCWNRHDGRHWHDRWECRRDRDHDWAQTLGRGRGGDFDRYWCWDRHWRGGHR